MREDGWAGFAGPGPTDLVEKNAGTRHGVEHVIPMSCRRGLPILERSAARATQVVLFAVFAMVASSGALFAQTVRKAPEIRKVERGFYIGSDFGPAFMVTKLDERSYGLGMKVGLHVGVDLLPILNMGVGVTGLTASVSLDANQPGPQGDLFFVIPTVYGRFALVTTERHFLWARGAAGFAIGSPNELQGVSYGGKGPSFAVSLGFERFTKLRRFAFGVELGALALTKPSFGVAIFLQPTIRYTF